MQDAGRFQYFRDGVPASGPADPLAFRAAQALVGNADTDAAIEIVGLPFAFSLSDTRLIAATGPDVSLIGRRRVPGWMAVLARRGEKFAVSGTSQSRFAYLAVSGGITAKKVLGSRSEYLPGRIGPLMRPLRSMDELPLGRSTVDLARAGRAVRAPKYASDIRVLLGPHRDRFSRATKKNFFSGWYEVSEASDRFGIRLRGSQVSYTMSEILSCGVLAGTVQIPPDGAPIVLMADHQSTGGYPVIAAVISADLGLLAQASVGARVRFTPVTPATARRALFATHQALRITLSPHSVEVDC